jgi:hypothetical protein
MAPNQASSQTLRTPSLDALHTPPIVSCRWPGLLGQAGRCVHRCQACPCHRAASSSALPALAASQVCLAPAAMGRLVRVARSVPACMNSDIPTSGDCCNSGPAAEPAVWAGTPCRTPLDTCRLPQTAPSCPRRTLLTRRPTARRGVQAVSMSHSNCWCMWSVSLTELAMP